MNKKYSIGFFAAIFVAATLVTFACQYRYHQEREELEARLKMQEELAMQENAQDTVETDGQAVNEDCYYLLEVNGYVVAYLGDKKTVYEYTDIPCECLPASVRQELKDGKCLQTQEELYGFLENYSS